MGRPMIRTEWCVCGGVISVGVPTVDDEVYRAVKQHNETARHRLWRERGNVKPDPVYEGRLG